MLLESAASVTIALVYKPGVTSNAFLLRFYVYSKFTFATLHQTGFNSLFDQKPERECQLNNTFACLAELLTFVIIGF